MRGNPDWTPTEDDRSRSIPAGAGEPRPPAAAGRWKAVYPRGCGGTGARKHSHDVELGLSPRVRGNRCSYWCPQRACRSIPAGAGEPPAGSASPSSSEVYPRGCGGTASPPGAGGRPRGLSPRVRGNRRDRPVHLGAERSIPAGAGEPGPTVKSHQQHVVYPRGCGGTEARYYVPIGETGLSPRVRGNLSRREHLAGRGGSIPAGAGEPTIAKALEPIERVYPRGCGGTPPMLSCGRSVVGLSPRVRGNRTFRRPFKLGQGSIPAGAGEPPPDAPRMCATWVYPRGCGGTP